MAKRINAGKGDKVMRYGALSQKIFVIAQTKHHLMGDFIPDQTATYWRIGQVLAWYAEDLLENLALDLRRRSGKSWQARDLAKMAQLRLHYPTVERLSGRYVGRKRDMSLDELLDVGK